MLAVIPARYESSRFPGKPLALLWGKPLIQVVYEAVSRHASVDRVIVATDSNAIQQCVLDFHGHVVLTTSSARTGSDRVAEVASTLSAEAIVNVQGDEVLPDPRLLEGLIGPFLQSDGHMGTLRRRITTRDKLHNPNIVKVVADTRGKALYFSRSPIPHCRDSSSDSSSLSASDLIYEHVGVYIYRPHTLRTLAELPTGTLEHIEHLEQLRALEAGISIQVWETVYPSFRIDTHDDLAEANTMHDPYSHSHMEIAASTMNTRRV